MNRLTVPARTAAPAASQPLLDAVEKSLGSVPNLFQMCIRDRLDGSRTAPLAR